MSDDPLPGRDHPPSTADPESAVAAEQPLAYRVVRGGLWLAAGSYFTIAFGFLANLILTRILDPENFGIYALATFLYSIVSLRPKLAVGPAFAQRRQTTGALIGTHLGLESAGGFGTLLLAALAIPAILLLGYPAEVAWVTLALAVSGVMEAHVATATLLLDKELHFKQASLVNAVVFPLSYFPAFWLAVAGFGVWALVAQTFVYAMLSLAGQWWAVSRTLPHLWRQPRRFDRSEAAALLRFGMPLGLAGVAMSLVGQFDNFLIGTFVGLATLGFYDRAYRTSLWPALLLTNLATRTAFFTYARLQDDRERLSKTVTMTLWLATTFGLPLALAIAAAAPDLIVLLYGERWLPSATFLRFLVVYAALRPVVDVANSLFSATGRPRLLATVSWVEALTLVAAGLPLTIAAGALGTVTAVGIAYATGFALRLRQVRRIVDVSLWGNIVVPAVAATLVVGAIFALNRLLGTADWPLIARVLVKSAGAAVGFLALLALFQPRLLRFRVRYLWSLIRQREVATNA